jgi:hypothetical protein
MGDQAIARPLPTHKQNKRRQTSIYTLSGISIHDPSVRVAKTFHALDHATTVIGFGG